MKINKQNLQNILSKIKQPKTALIFLTFSLLSYILLVLASNSSIIISYLLSLNVSGLFTISQSLLIGYPGSVETYILVSVIITALLIGLNISLLTEILTVEGTTGGLTGSFLGLTASGCAACTTGVMTMAGASIGLGFLPFNGLEFNIVGIILLGYTALYISEKDHQKICEV